MELSILYRGPLSSCNYGCAYCPFAKRKESRAELARDRAALRRLVDWVSARPATDRISILFTPWGEALVRRAYREALSELSQRASVARVGAQTNLSGPLDFVDGANVERLRLWCTYHPEWVSRARFLWRVRWLAERGVRLSVGMVGFRRFLPEIEALRAALPERVYLWVNVPKSASEKLDASEMERLRAVDPLVGWNAVRHPSLGRACDAGARALSVDGDGTVRRCHFVETPLGNLYDEPELLERLAPRPCPAATCGCHIGYVHLPHLRAAGLDAAFGDEALFRLAADWPWDGARRGLPVMRGADGRRDVSAADAL